ncbi:MAG: twin-arginine translocase TatA/TatE family subunit [Chloroflexota bacterium]
MLGLPRGSEWIIILVIVILLFGPGRIGKIASELGKGIRSFRDGLSEGKQEEGSTDSSSKSESK